MPYYLTGDLISTARGASTWETYDTSEVPGRAHEKIDTFLFSEAFG